MPEGSFTSSYLQHHGGDPYGTGVGVGTLSMNGQALAVTNTTIATDFNKSLDVKCYVTAKVAFHAAVMVDIFSQLGNVVLAQISYAVSGFTPVAARISLAVLRPIP